ncbi:extracellular tyrosine-protein kinase PKDCC isoform X1 [Clupea harengus]|uniref:Extracellular tyrosine-protein kinase PKDCC n=2 Tax=Clupea harengus TaxID=7950 RepID=A0A6P8GBW3_CLUHA|nr:extracellular tyrosine-protein kinase PKDCC isoform X1 [Clupea harengus]
MLTALSVSHIPRQSMSSTRSPLCAVALFALLVLASTFLMRNWHYDLQEKTFASRHLDVDFLSLQNILFKELQERHEEIIPFYIASDGDNLLEFSGNFVSFYPSIKPDKVRKYNHKEILIGSSSPDEDMVACDQLDDMKVVDFLGSGYTKFVVKADLPDGLTIALKSINDQGTDMRKCLEEFKDPVGCHELVSFKLKKEIILLQRLQHPNIVKLKGHCRDKTPAGGITAILEQGTPLQMIQLLQSPWEERFRVCLGLVRLLHFLSESPLGSVALLDFQPRQFVMVEGELKLTDLDDATTREPLCRTDADCLLQFPLRNFSARCSERGLCEGMNEMRNLYNAHRYFFLYLLPHQAPVTLRPLVDQIMNSTAELRNNTNGTLEAFEEVFHIFRSGRHLENLPPTLIREYTSMRGVSSAGNVDYRCWPSYNQQGCVLSVHSTREAAAICHSHPQCTSFSLRGQRTWTGRLLATFRSGFSHLVPDVHSVVYMRKTKASLGGAPQ